MYKTIHQFGAFFTKLTPKFSMFMLLFGFCAVLQAQTPQYFCDIRNETYVSPQVFEFDLYLTSTGSSALELACFQSGIKLNSSFVNGGTVTPSIVAGNSDLISEQVPISIGFVAGSDNCVRIAPRTPPRTLTPPTSSTFGTTISSGLGMKVCRVRLTNSVDFGMDPATYAWNYSVSPYNTIISAYIPGSPAVNTVITNANSKTVSNTITLFLEGLYTGPMMRKSQDELGDHFQANVADQITVKLAMATAPYTIVREFSNVNLLQNGKCAVSIPSSIAGNYYIVVSHRNSIETWSAAPIAFSSVPLEYNFTDASSKAYGDNQATIGGVFAVFGGDVDVDGSVGINDLGITENSASVFGAGYLVEDVDGDGSVGISDLGLIENNSANFVSVLAPGGKKMIGKTH